VSARVIAVVQARRGSTRLPGKALMDVGGRPMLEHVLARAAAVPGVDQVVLATTALSEDDALADVARAVGIACVRGSVEDVLDRFRAALAAHPADAVLRICADCPLLDPFVSGRVVRKYRRLAGNVDYVSNVHPPRYPDGLDTEVIAASALETAWREASPGPDREHVTPYIWNRRERFRLENVTARKNLSGHRWTVDNERDLDFVREVYRRLATREGPPYYRPAMPEELPRLPRDIGARRAATAGRGPSLFGMDAVLELLRAHPEIAAINAGTQRNEGYRPAEDGTANPGCASVAEGSVARGHRA
jgi:spore coat polysaccharide biosynthesis protein SpsF (cytidylyltransferase family)